MDFPLAAEAGLRLRPITDSDQPFLAAVYASTRIEELAGLDWPEAEKQKFLRQQFDAQHMHYMHHYPAAQWLVVEAGSAAVGRLYFVRWPREIRVIDIALLPEARGRGFGSALLRDVIAAAADESRAVSIHVERMNPALALYFRLGFSVAENKGVYLLLERSA